MEDFERIGSTIDYWAVVWSIILEETIEDSMMNELEAVVWLRAVSQCGILQQNIICKDGWIFTWCSSWGIIWTVMWVFPAVVDDRNVFNEVSSEVFGKVHSARYGAVVLL